MNTKRRGMYGLIACILTATLAFAALSMTGCESPTGGNPTGGKTLTGITLNTEAVKKNYVQNETLNLAGLVVTAAYSDGTSAAVTNYTASPIDGAALAAIGNDIKVTISYTEGGVTQTADFSVIVEDPDSIPITTAEISITAPVKDMTPDTTATGTGNFTIGAVSWEPNHSTFAGGTVYTVSITLTANSGHTFTGLTTATIGGETATVSNNIGAAVTLSRTFSATLTKTVNSIAIKTQPTKVAYTHGDKLDLAGLVITLNYDDTTDDDVEFDKFAEFNITANPAHDGDLYHTEHDQQTVKITYGNKEAATGKLTVNPKNISGLTVDTIATVTYTGTAHTPTVTVKDGEATLATTDYTVGYTNNTNAGTATVTITGAGNYTGSKDVNFTINKAAGAAVSALTGTSTNNSVTLNTVTIPTNPGNQTVEYAHNTANTAPSTGWQSGTSFNDLSAGTTYYFFARSVGNANYETGTPSSAAIATKQEASFTITFDQIAEGAPTITGPTLSKSGTGTATLTVTSPEQYTGIEWSIDGTLRRSGATLNLNAANYTVGTHTITLNVVKAGVPYNRTITFTVN